MRMQARLEGLGFPVIFDMASKADKLPAAFASASASASISVPPTPANAHAHAQHQPLRGHVRSTSGPIPSAAIGTLESHPHSDSVIPLPVLVTTPTTSPLKPSRSVAVRRMSQTDFLTFNQLSTVRENESDIERNKLIVSQSQTNAADVAAGGDLLQQIVVDQSADEAAG